MILNEQHILQLRARELAMKETTATETGSFVEAICFVLQPEKYAIESSYVQEVLSLKDITPIPGTPGFVMGVINFRGMIVSVVNLKMVFGIMEQGLTEMNKVILIKHEAMMFGLVADEIAGIMPIFKADLSAPPITLDPAGAGLVEGITTDGIILLNARQLIHSNQLVIN